MKDMNKAITDLANSMTADYALCQARYNLDSPEIEAEALAKYESELDFKFGRKYIKVLNNRSCAGFIVNTDGDPKFERGDMLMAASFSSPARNKARGNIFNNDDVLKVRWVGIS